MMTMIMIMIMIDVDIDVDADFGFAFDVEAMSTIGLNVITNMHSRRPTQAASTSCIITLRYSLFISLH